MSHFATADGPEGVTQQMATIETAATDIPLPRCGQLGRHAVAPFDPWQLGPPQDHSVWRFAERLLE